MNHLDTQIDRTHTLTHTHTHTQKHVCIFSLFTNSLTTCSSSKKNQKNKVLDGMKERQIKQITATTNLTEGGHEGNILTPEINVYDTREPSGSQQNQQNQYLTLLKGSICPYQPQYKKFI